MKIVKKLFVLSAVLGVPLLSTSPVAFAATSPDLGQASSFVVLSSTYTNTGVGTTLTGDLGYSTGPGVAPTVNGTTYGAADAKYTQAGIDQAAALSNLDSQPCTFTFAPGAIDLASDITHGPVGVYTPGVYCIDGAGSIGGGGTITLNGAGTYIFRTTGAFTTSAGSVVATSNGASACDVWWTPAAAVTLGANSTFFGNIISASGNTVGDTVNWTGRALSFGGTVSTDADTITAPTCAAPTTTPTPVTTAAATSTTPGLPNTGLGAESNNNTTVLVSAFAAIMSLSAIAYIRNRA